MADDAAHPEVEVTPEMIEAGWAVLAARMPDAEEAMTLAQSGEVLSQIYSAMASAAQ